MARSSERAKESLRMQGHERRVAFENDDSGELACVLPLLQSGQRLIFRTQGSAKPPPWAEFCNRFAVIPTRSVGCCAERLNPICARDAGIDVKTPAFRSSLRDGTALLFRPRHFVPGYFHAVPPGRNRLFQPQPSTSCWAAVRDGPPYLLLTPGDATNQLIPAVVRWCSLSFVVVR
jgi:hypothetical protein